MLVTNLLGRNVVRGWDGKLDGVIVAVFVDRGQVSVIVEDHVEGTTDGRTTLRTLCAEGLLLGKEGLKLCTVNAAEK
jgi:hypothetical protein